jgi:hypothetical protein
LPDARKRASAASAVGSKRIAAPCVPSSASIAQPGRHVVGARPGGTPFPPADARRAPLRHGALAVGETVDPARSRAYSAPLEGIRDFPATVIEGNAELGTASGEAVVLRREERKAFRAAG